MKPYGFSRRDKLTCAYGCCELHKGSRVKNCAKRNRRRARKVARRTNKVACNSE